MARGKFVRVDGDAFTICDDKLYLNYSMRVTADWHECKDGLIELADCGYSEEVEL